MKTFFIYCFSLFICAFSYGQIKSKYTGFGNINNNYSSLTSLSRYKLTTSVKLPVTSKIYYNNPNFKNLNKRVVLGTKVYPYFSMNYAGIGVNNYSSFTINSTYKYSTTEIAIESIFAIIDIFSFLSYY